MRKHALQELIPQIDRIIPIRFFLLYNFQGEHRIFVATSKLLYGYRGYLLAFDKRKRFDVLQAMKLDETIGEHMDQDDGILCCEINEIITFLNTTPYYNVEGANILKKLLQDEDD